jgi:hypothetical protein
VAPNPSGGWKVENQVAKVGLDGSGRAVEGMEVFFVTAKGNHASVFIPKARYNVDTVRAAVMEQVAVIDAIHDLKG